MSSSLFRRYVGDPDFHDGSILAVDRQDEAVRVRVRGASGRVFVVDFSGVCDVRANRAERMFLFALGKLRGEPSFRRFVFVNWDDGDDAFLEIDASIVSVLAE